MSKKSWEFINRIAMDAIEINRHNKDKLLPSVAIAQAVLESGYGTTTLYEKANNAYGIKISSSWIGEKYEVKTTEYQNGIAIKVLAYFRKYETVTNSIEDYYNLITGLKRYQSALNQKTPLETITAIVKSGYATDPNYITKVMKIINENDLTFYDTVESVTSGTTDKNDYFYQYIIKK